MREAAELHKENDKKMGIVSDKLVEFFNMGVKKDIENY